jgi:hypothetical protein
MKMTKGAVFVMILINLIAVGGAVSLVLFPLRSFPESKLTAGDLDRRAAQLAAQSSQAAIAEVLHRDDAFIRTLMEIVRKQQALQYWVAAGVVLVAAVNLFHIIAALFGANPQDLSRR